MEPRPNLDDLLRDHRDPDHTPSFGTGAASATPRRPLAAQVFCIGIATIDEVMTVDALPTGEAKLLAIRHDEVGGGCAANAAVAISRLGGDAAFGGLLGDDRIGELAAEGLAAEGVDTSDLVRVRDATTPLSLVLLDRSGRRVVVNHSPPGYFDVTPPRERPALEVADAVLADVRWLPGASAALRRARERGIPGVVDADRTLTGHALSMLADASHVVFSREGLLGTTGEADLVAGLRRIRSEEGSHWIAVTDGPNGVYWLCGDRVCHAPAFPVDAVDTLGAGDAFHGAFALALAEGADEATAVVFASATAALKCTRPGGRDGFPTRGQVAAFHFQAAPRTPLAVADLEPVTSLTEVS
jgi:sulfofructose kinase